MNEEEERMQAAQEIYDGMEKEEREWFEGATRLCYEEAAQNLGSPPGRLGMREMCITLLARLIVGFDAEAAPWVSEFVTEEETLRYAREENERLEKLPEYAATGVPEAVLYEAMAARLYSEHPAAARHPSAPAE